MEYNIKVENKGISKLIQVLEPMYWGTTVIELHNIVLMICVSWEQGECL